MNTRNIDSEKESELEILAPPITLRVRISGLPHLEARRQVLAMVYRECEGLFRNLQNATILHDDSLITSWFRAEKLGISFRKVLDPQSAQQKAGFEIRMRRMEIGLTQVQLAHELGIDRAHLSELENGHHLPSPRMRRRLKRYFRRWNKAV